MIVKNILLKIKIIPEIVENISGIISLRPFAARSDCRIKSLARNALRLHSARGVWVCFEASNKPYLRVLP